MSEKTEKSNEKSFRKIFKLRQQTPMIHFQHNDDGVIIRASEFKPKLDKFIVKKLGEKLNTKTNWFLKQTDENKSIALNYKVKIYVTGKPEKSETIKLKRERNTNTQKYGSWKNVNRDKKINEMYFANMGDDTDSYKETIFYKEDICVEIYCFISDLLKYISDNMEEFILITNFGTRQSKGFGSFALLGDSVIDPIEVLKKNKYKFIYGNFVNGRMKELPQISLDVAKVIYAVMKGGINTGKYNNKIYIKGYIQRQYLDDCNESEKKSDKAFIKSMLIKNNSNKNNRNYRYVRALLGITDQMKFGKEKIIINGNKIERFASSIQISIWGNYIFLIMKDQEYINHILKKKFTFSCNENHQEIETPETFDAATFLSGFVKYYNKEKEKLKDNFNFKNAAKIELKMVEGKEER